MSANFTGVTFPNQKVTPANDAVIRRAIFDDGILTGSELFRFYAYDDGGAAHDLRASDHPPVVPELGSNRGNFRVCPTGADDRRHPYQHEGHL